MSHKQKLQKFRVQIRNKEIKQIIAQKRLLRDYYPQNCNLIPQIQPINLALLMHIAKVAQFQQNIQPLYRLGWHKQLAPFLSPEYNFTDQQRYAAAALCNIMYVQDFSEPTQNMTQNILHILEGNSSMKVLESILTLISNIAHDHKVWLDGLILNHSLIPKLVHIFSFQNLNHSILYHLLLTICQVLSVASFSPQFVKLVEPIFNLINSNLALDSEFLRPTFYCLSQLSKKFQKQISLKTVESRFFKKIGPFIKILSDMRIIDNYVMLVSQTIEHLQCETFQGFIFPILCQRLASSTLKVKEKILRVMYYALQQKKLDLLLFWKKQVSTQLLQIFEVADNLNILQQLCYIFCICIINLKNRKEQTELLRDLINRKRMLLSQNIDIQGLIDETLLIYQKENGI